MSLKVLNNSPAVSLVCFYPKASAICSEGRAPFTAEVTVAYIPNLFLLEFEDFERWLREIANEEHTIESLTARIFDELEGALGPELALQVTLDATTTRHAPATCVKQQGEWP